MRLLVCLVLAFCVFWTRPATAELANGIQAIVHDSVITYQQVQTLNLQTVPELQRQYGNQREVMYEKARQIQTNNVEKLMNEQLILHDFKTAGYSLPESVIDDMVRERIKADFGDRRTLIKTLEARGMTTEKFRETVREQVILRAMREKNISSEILISPHKIETYYDEHKAEYKVEDQVKLRMIVLTKSTDSNAKQLAEEISQKLKEGVPFAEMATIHSQGSQRKDGGDWGWVEKSVLRKELAEIAFGLKPGERSGVIETADACYVMLVEDTRSAHYKPLVDVRDQIDQVLTLEERGRLEKQWVNKLRKKTFTKYY